MLKFYDYFPDIENLSTLSAKLSWSHFVELLQDKLKRDFYVTMCANEFWGVRTLRESKNCQGRKESKESWNVIFE